MSARILAIVVNWRQAAMTLECVAALRAMTLPVDVVVVDNGSGEADVALLVADLGRDWVIALPENVGFAAGNNAGLRRALTDGYDYALLVNNDAFAAPDMAAQLLSEAQDDIALLSPKIFYEAEPTRIWFGGARMKPATLDIADNGRGEPDGAAFATRDVDYVLGTCLLVNMAISAEVGLLDERYFMYFEDLDWSLRMRQAGYRLRFVADAHLWHRVAMSTGGRQDSPLRRYYLARSSVIFWRRHASEGNRLAIVTFRLASALKMVARLTLTGEFATARAYLRGLRDGWRLSDPSANVPSTQQRE